MSVTSNLTAVNASTWTSANGGMCSNPTCIRMSQAKCTECLQGYCHGHSHHPEHV